MLFGLPLCALSRTDRQTDRQTDNLATIPRQHVHMYTITGITVKSADFGEHWPIKMKYAHIIVSVFVHKK